MPSTMNKLKLQSHQKNYREEDLLVNVKDLGSEVKAGDVIEIYHPEDDLPRLLLKIPSTLDEINLQKDTISIEQSIAATFQLRNYKDVIVNTVEPKAVELELVELTFKDQYLGRSDMWRLKMHLVNSVVYLNKKIEFCGGSIRTQVYEMWAQGGKVACGVVSENTKVVYRSSTSMVYLFIQMSSEMWDFDLYGDLYFEKAVNGFLSELFAKWKKEGSNHDVTIVLFSRTYYKASSIDEFPTYMRECLQEDYKGRFYEDFYRVAVQNERYDDWSPTLTCLRHMFNNYLPSVLHHHRQPGVSVPEAVNSSASQGNFLEVLNISLNVFEKHYLDRSFDRTGQVSVVVTPGVGVFEVDRELTNITKQRIIDNGVGSDLVCVGEQPLHAVPLLKFHNKKGGVYADDYSMPHTWINLSFYSAKKKLGYGTFTPRIKLPPEKPKSARRERLDHYCLASAPCMKPALQDTTLPNSIFDYDTYDAQVFKLPSSHNNKTYRSLQRTTTRKKTAPGQPPPSTSVQPLTRVSLHRKLSDPDLYSGMEQISSSLVAIGTSVSSVMDKTPAINIPARITENKTYSQSFGALNVEGVQRPRTQALYEGEEPSPSHSIKVGSSNGTSPCERTQLTKNKPMSTHRPGRSLINPFDPSHMTIKLTSNRRRWIHIFPKDQTGVLIQQHHYQVNTSKAREHQPSPLPTPEGDVALTPHHHHHHNITSTPTKNGLDATTTATEMRNGTDVEVNGLRQRSLVTQQSQESINGLRRDSKPRTTSQNSSLTSADMSMRSIGTPQKASISGGVGSGSMGGGGMRTVTGGTTGKAKFPATLIWGATGEQEWTAGLTTGVDWKSLTLPACLPITTDYFPEDQSLHNDYVVADYNLLVDEPDESVKRPLTTKMVFLELVSQRLAQGFQMIMLGEGAGVGGAVAGELGSGGAAGYSGVGSFIRNRSRTHHNTVTQEYRLSIGRIFHKILLYGSTITVTIYRPRHPYPQLKRQYKYRFRAPEMSSYEVSWVDFRTERLETYMWNHLDNYICFRGESPDYPLIDPLKFWRFRVLLVGDCFRSATKSIQDTEGLTDIYGKPTLEDQQETIEGFLRFMEITVHRLKKPVNARKSRNVGGIRERLGSNRVLERPRPRLGSRNNDRLRFESGGGREAHPDPPEMKSLIEPEEEAKEEGESKKLALGSSLAEVAEAMRDSVKGVCLLQRQPCLPALTFVAGDATAWVCDHVEGAASETAAVELLQKMQKSELICHATGDRRHPFIHGFFLYFFITGNKEQDQVTIDPLTFHNEWHEVEVEPLSSPPRQAPPAPPPCPTFLQADLPPPSPRQGRIKLYRTGHLDLDCNNRSDRIEWGHIKYHSVFGPHQAYELIVQWLCATGTIVTDLMVTWQRKAQACGLYLFPVPSDPFALPYSCNSDPLRGPILVPLSVSCLTLPGHEPFAQFPADSWGRRMHLFQEAILERFGFMPYVTDSHSTDPNQFVHVTGHMFVMIHSPDSCAVPHTPDTTTRPRTFSATVPLTQADFHYGVSSPHVEYFHRLIADLYSHEISEHQPGFLWTFNYMLTRRWKIPQISGDESLAERMLHDFRLFCANKHNRLREFWDSHLPFLSSQSPGTPDDLINEP